MSKTTQDALNAAIDNTDSCKCSKKGPCAYHAQFVPKTTPLEQRLRDLVKECNLLATVRRQSMADAHSEFDRGYQAASANRYAFFAEDIQLLLEGKSSNIRSLWEDMKRDSDEETA